MGRFPKLGTLFNRDFRNSYNQGVDKIDAELDAQINRVDNLIANAPQPSEVVDARGGEAVLGNRLNNFDTQLAQTTQEIGVEKTSTLPLWLQESLREVSKMHDDYLREIGINIRQPPYNAKGDGITSDTEVIRRVISEAKKGSTIIIPPSSSGYLVTHDLEKFIFKVDKPLRFVGQGINSMIVLEETIPLDTDVFLISPSSASNTEGYGIEGVTIIGRNGSEPARHAIHLDTTLDHQKVSRSLFSRNFLYPTGGWSIYLSNPTNTDGFYTSQIQKNLIYSGIYFQRGGDSLIISENTITGDNGVDISLVDGSNSLVFSYNNYTAKNAIIFRSGHNIKIHYNNLEVGSAESFYINGALLDIDGTDIPYAWGLLSVDIIGNNLTYRTTAPDNVTGIRINKARGCRLEGNYITHKNSTMIHITSSANETIIGYNLYSNTDNTAILIDEGTNTKKKDYKKKTPSGTIATYELIKNIGRWDIAESWLELNKINYETKTDNNAPSFNHIWKEAGLYASKYRFSTQRRNTLGTLEPEKVYSELRDGRQMYHQNGLSLKAPDGSEWLLNVNNDGTLSTTKM